MPKASVTRLAPHSVQARRRAVSRNPDSPQARRDLAEALEDAGLDSHDTDPVKALAQLREAVGVRRELAGQTQEIGDWFEYDISPCTLAALTAATDPAGAITVQQESVALGRELITQIGRHRVVVEMLQSSLHRLADWMLLQQGTPMRHQPEIEEVVTEAVDLARELVLATPEDVSFRRALAGSLGHLAWLRMADDDPETARELRREEVGLLRRVVGHDEATAADRERLAHATMRLSAAHLNTNPVTAIAVGLQAVSLKGRTPLLVRAGAGLAGKALGRFAAWQHRRISRVFDGIDTPQLRQLQGRPTITRLD